MQGFIKRPKVSIILTSYNHARYLQKSIESVLDQTYRDYELIIVDDASTDESWDIISSYDDSRIVKVRHSCNYGHGVLWDTIQRYARGKYIAVHHSDDLWENRKLEIQVAFLEEHSEYGCVFTGVNVINEDGSAYSNKDGFYYDAFQVLNMPRHEWIRHLIEKGNCLCHPSVLTRREVYFRAKPFGEGLRQVPDLLMWIRICMKYEIYVLPDKLVSFRVHDQGKNTSGLRRDTQIRSSVETLLLLEELLKIKNREDFTAVFPQANLIGNSKYDIACALAFLCLNEQKPKYANLFGLQILYRLLNQKKGRSVLAENYGFTSKSYFELTGKYDVFKVLKPHCDQEATLFRMIEKDNWGLVETRRYFLSEKECLNFSFDISTIDIQTEFLRFDPCEFLYIKAKSYKCAIDGCETKIQGFSQHSVVDDMLMFLTKDPIFIIDYLPGNKLEIEVELERML